MGRLYSLQILRFLAALAVAWSHAWGMRHGAHTIGAAGVDVFFVISGFIVSRAAAASRTGFLRLRLVRVLPMYYLALAPFLIDRGLKGALTPLALLASLTLWPAWGDRWAFSILDVAWTLSYELVFYVGLAALLAGARAWWLWSAWAICLVTGVATRWPVFLFLGSPLVLEFGLGAAIGRWAPASRRAGALAIVFAVLAFGGFAALASSRMDSMGTMDPSAGWRVVEWGLPAAALVYGVLQYEHLARSPLARLPAFLGDASYSLYLFHLLVMAIVLAIAPGVSATIMIITAVLASAVIYRLVEQPLIGALKRAVLAREKPVEPSIVQA